MPLTVAVQEGGLGQVTGEEGRKVDRLMRSFFRPSIHSIILSLCDVQGMSLKPFRGVLRMVTRIPPGWQGLASTPSSPPLGSVHSCAFTFFLVPEGIVPQSLCTAVPSPLFMNHSWCALFPRPDAEGSSEVLASPPPRPLEKG